MAITYSATSEFYTHGSSKITVTKELVDGTTCIIMTFDFEGEKFTQVLQLEQAMELYNMMQFIIFKSGDKV